ncbi:MAG: CotH kinase family protein [Bacteroidales bacterium]
MEKQEKNILKLTGLLVLLLFTPVISAQIDFSYQSEYSYVKGKATSPLPGSWKDTGYDYSSWEKGRAPFWYGDGTGGTELTDMMNSYTTLFLRSTFECRSSALIKEITFLVDYDDGFIIWVNGVLALSSNAPSNPAYNSLATANHESGTGVLITVSTASLGLIDGLNSIAVQCFNVNLTSTDLYFDMEIHARKDLPVLVDTIGISFSAGSGFFGQPFSLVLMSPDSDSKIIYTLDGSNPETSLTGFITDSPVTIPINPEDSMGRPATPAVIVRASLCREGFNPSRSATRTYIFTEKVTTQSWPGGDWPSGSVNGQLIDLEMDREVVNDPAYQPQINNSLFDLPSISIVTDLKNLFDPASGIYVNAMGHGLGWERECSAELINPDGSAGFNLNAGLRIRGGWSRNDDFTKHAFRLFFREEYGSAKLRYPLFGNEGVSEFDKIDLRCEQNYAWSTGLENNSMVREVFSRDTQRDMGQPYTRSRYYHLYLNGMYWGIYQSQERSEARYAESYFGGSNEEYDVIKVDTESGYNVEATDGNSESWTDLWNMCNKGFISNADYFKIEGRDQDGKPVKGGEVMVDLDNLIDFMLVIFYSGNFDSPVSSFMQNKSSNNFYAIDNREDNSKGFVFFVHDAEHSLFDEPHAPGIGLYEDRVNIAARADNMQMDVTNVIKFHPQWLHFRLSANPEYRMRFADRAFRHLSPEGVFSPDSCLKRLDKRVSEIDLAVIAESARWGDSKRPTGTPYTRNVQWLSEIRKIRNNFFPYRTPIVINQLKSAGLYSLIDAPVITNAAGPVSGSESLITPPVSVSIENPGNSGTIYFTLDGTDPRDPGGSVSRGVRFSLGRVSLLLEGPAVIKARVLAEGYWSPLREVNFISTRSDYTGLRVTELHYHPAEVISGQDTIDGKDLEFIEFKNTGSNAINLSGLMLDSAVYYVFPLNRLLAPREFYVLASKPSKFYDQYGLVASGNFKGNFSNDGEEVLLETASGRTVIDFIYSDAPPWPADADGGGYSLSSAAVNPANDPLDYSYWTLSVKKDGTPFADNTLPEENEEELSGNPLIIYPNPTTGIVTVQLITEDAGNNLEIDIFTITGRLIRQVSTGNPGLIDLSDPNLPSGVYILNVRSGSFRSRIPVILKK